MRPAHPAHAVARGHTKGRISDHLPLLPAIALALLPKYPLCLAAWFGLAGVVGASSWLTAAWRTPLWITLTSFAVGTLALSTRRSHDARPLLVGLLGAAALLAGKYSNDLLLLCAGVALLIGASTGSYWPRSFRTGCLRVSIASRKSLF